MTARHPRFPLGPAAAGITKGKFNAHHNTHYICHDVGTRSHTDSPSAHAAGEPEAAVVPGDHAASDPRRHGGRRDVDHRILCGARLTPRPETPAWEGQGWKRRTDWTRIFCGRLRRL